MQEHASDVELDVIELWVHSIGRTTRVLSPFGLEPDERLVLEAPPDQEVAGLTSGGVSILLRQGTSSTSPIARHVAAHGDDVADVGLTCGDVEGLVERALACGVRASVEEGCAKVDLLGDGTLRHSVRRRGLRPLADRHRHDVGPQMRAVDHVTYCLPFGTIDRAARAYQIVFGLTDVAVPDAGSVGDGSNGMRSRVLRSPRGFTVVLTEPMSPASAGQTQHFLRAHAGAGVQHLAIAYDDLVAAVQWLRSKGVPFLSVPQEHLERSYRDLRDVARPWDTLQREGILVDADEKGFLFQLFTEPITDRGTFFFELIHRDGSTGFGARNVRALFAAVDASIRHDPARAPFREPSLEDSRSSERPVWTDELVRRARETVPFYREHLAGFEGAPFREVPTFEKSMAARHGRFPLSAGGAPGAHRVLATSGTSGHRLYVSFDESEWNRTARWLEHVGRRVGVSSDDVLLNTHCYGLWVGGPALDLLANRCGAGLVPLGPVSPPLVLELLADGVGTAISATPSYLRRLIETAQAMRFDLRRTPLRFGFIGAEPAEDPLRQKLLSQLPDGFQWIELYGLTETGGPSVAFAPDPGIAELTLNTKDFLVEVLDPGADRPVALGQVGELTITSRRTDGRTPLVRYRTRDLVQATAGDVDAPTRISRILGRADHSLKIGGVLLYPSAVTEIMSEFLPAAAEWRALVSRRDEDDELVVEAEAPRDLCQAVERAFRERIGLGLTVNPMPAGTFSRGLEKTQRILITSSPAALEIPARRQPSA